MEVNLWGLGVMGRYTARQTTSEFCQPQPKQTVGVGSKKMAKGRKIDDGSKKPRLLGICFIYLTIIRSHWLSILSMSIF